MEEALKKAVNPIVHSLIQSLADLHNEGRRFLEKPRDAVNQLGRDVVATSIERGF